MESRRDFLKKAALLSGATVMWTVPESIQRALAISPEPGTTFLDAEHIVILMQENRSFDHCYGMLRGVRGYRDPRVHTKPDGNPVWLQVSGAGQTFAPFRLNMKRTNITWLGGLPHNWDNQIEARNDGCYDKWLIAKPSGYKPLADKPMTLGHYTREDIPFYYALADAFTVCDQNFCSLSLTGTTPNRLYLWSGTIRAEQRPDSKANVYNEDADHDHQVSWPTFPERLEDAGISWKVYQNELDIDSGLTDDEDEWLANFSDNPLEFMTQYRVRFSPRRREYLKKQADRLPNEIETLTKAAQSSKDRKKLAALKAELVRVQSELDEFGQEQWNKLPDGEKALYEKAFVVNDQDPNYRTLESIQYSADDEKRTASAPKGDILHQFREDVQNGNLPTVSWLIGPEHFSDHPSSAWFGAWYVSETLDILTQNPEIWKKTIFILNYDENDGYFDHVPPFVAPNPTKPESGKVSEGIDPAVEFVTKEQDESFHPGYSPQESSIGLGYRVPMVIASPWNRGGCVCSEVFDHTSVIQFLERFLSHKTGQQVEEPNISTWRRTICGDLTSTFQDDANDQGHNPAFLDRDKFVEEIYQARYNPTPSGFTALSEDEIDEIRRSPQQSPYMPQQEKGTRKSCPLPYELFVDGKLSSDGSRLVVRFKAGKTAFGKKLEGAPFNAYAYLAPGRLQERSYAVTAGDELTDDWQLSHFESGVYHIRIDGPNGFMREFKGKTDGLDLGVEPSYVHMRQSRDLEVLLTNPQDKAVTVILSDLSYGAPKITKKVKAHSSESVSVSTKAGQGWYDLAIQVDGDNAFLRRCAGRVENGRWGVTDPAMA